MEGMRRNKGLTGLALLAILALMLSVTVGTAATAAGGSAAEIAKKKKCKKKKASSSKKKKCKKKKKKGAKPAPLVRATLTWDTNADFDLWVFDTAGNRARAASNTIANTTFSANDTMDTDGLGPETFTDNIFKKPGRAFSYGVCFQDGGSNPTNFTLDYVTADGVHHTGNQGVDPLGSDGAHREFDGGAPIPADYCPAP